MNQDGRLGNESLTRRDHFAAAALVGICANPTISTANDHMARVAFALADAMLEAREEE